MKACELEGARTLLVDWIANLEADLAQAKTALVSAKAKAKDEARALYKQVKEVVKAAEEAQATKEQELKGWDEDLAMVKGELIKSEEDLDSLTSKVTYGFYVVARQ